MCTLTGPRRIRCAPDHWPSLRTSTDLLGLTVRIVVKALGYSVDLLLRRPQVTR